MARGSRTNGKPRDDEAPGRGHNQMNKDERAKIIRDACKRVSALTAKRDEIGAEISQIKNEKIKGLLDMKIADFNAALRLYNLDDDDRAVMMDTMRETFEALGVGDQLDWLVAAEKAEKVRNSDAAEAEPMH